jgi:uncharacterized protein YcbK (DUF882 family)
MRSRAVLVSAFLLSFCAGPVLHAAQKKEISAAELLERFPLMLDSAPQPPEVSEAEIIELEEGDPETYIFIHGATAHPPEPVNLGGDGRLYLSRPDTGEAVSAAYRNKDGSYNPSEIDKIQWLMRCRLTGKETPVSIKLLEILDAVEDRFGARGLTLLSGYRTPKFNRSLRGAARRSRHMLGWAADIRVPGHPPGEAAEFAGKLAAGGVGYYPDAAFVHLDSGRFRRWKVGKPAPRPRGLPVP